MSARTGPTCIREMSARDCAQEILDLMTGASSGECFEAGRLVRAMDAKIGAAGTADVRALWALKKGPVEKLLSVMQTAAGEIKSVMRGLAANLPDEDMPTESVPAPPAPPDHDSDAEEADPVQASKRSRTSVHFSGAWSKETPALPSCPRGKGVAESV